MYSAIEVARDFLERCSYFSASEMLLGIRKVNAMETRVEAMDILFGLPVTFATFPIMSRAACLRISCEEGGIP